MIDSIYRFWRATLTILAVVLLIIIFCQSCVAFKHANYLRQCRTQQEVYLEINKSLLYRQNYTCSHVFQAKLPLDKFDIV